jgi:Tfp pilus assembly protein PilW
MNMKYRQPRASGFSLIEMITYVAVLTIILLLVINMVMSLKGSYRQLIVLRALDRSAYNSLERMTRDIRNAVSVNNAQSAFGSSPGVLVVNQNIAGTSTPIRFYVQNGTLRLDVNGTFIGPLTVKNTAITSLMFSQMTGTSTAIKIDMTITASSGPIILTKPYRTTVILKGS